MSFWGKTPRLGVPEAARTPLTTDAIGSKEAPPKEPMKYWRIKAAAPATWGEAMLVPAYPMTTSLTGPQEEPDEEAALEDQTYSPPAPRTSGFIQGTADPPPRLENEATQSYA